MTKGLLAPLSLLVLSCAAAASPAAPLTLGFMTINDVGTPSGNPANDYVVFRLNNWNGYSYSSFSTPITFTNVTLDIMWANGVPPGITGPLNWYTKEDPLHLNPLNPRDLPQSEDAYESSFFQKQYGMTKGVLTFDLNPAENWSVNGGGTYTPPSSKYEMVFWLNAQSDGLQADEVLPSWYLALPDTEAIPEPSTYVLSGIGALAVLIGRRCKIAS